MKDKIIGMLKNSSQEYVSGEKLSEELGVSRTAIWKHIKVLREEGYTIESIPRKGYVLRETPDILTEVEIKNGLKTKILGKKIIHFDRVDSTNNVAKNLALQGEKEGMLVTAEEQGRGRGRRGREWKSPKGSGIWMTLLLRPDVLPREAPKFTLLAAVAVAKSIREEIHVDATIKWPNDIIINGKKACGILTEMNAEMDSVNYIILGIGINVNMVQEDFPPDVQEKAISLYQVAGYKVSRKRIVQRILENLEEAYLNFMDTGDFTTILKEWKEMSCTLGQQVRVLGSDKEIQGQAIDINQEGALIIKDQQNQIHEVFYGDVSIRGIYDYTK